MDNPFPPIVLEKIETKGQDRNPAVQLFGRRFFSDQTVPELLLEFLLVSISQKRIGDQLLDDDKMLPPLELLHNWPDRAHLEYAAKARLNLKLFTFLGASKLETRHESHRQQYHRLLRLITDADRLAVAGTTDPADVLRTLENLFLGFLGIGEERTWCAQSFLPVTPQFVAGESIWRETRARKEDFEDWNRALKFFSHSQQIFLSRGGELIYLQLCNALRQEQGDILKWISSIDLSLSEREKNIELLYHALVKGLNSIFDERVETVGKLAEFIDTGIDPKTSEQTDQENGNPRYSKCGWCPTESWQEGLLFAVELLRICDAHIDPIERIELLEISCAMQLLRSLCAQSVRNIPGDQKEVNWPGFFWVISDPEGQHEVLKQISRRSVSTMQRIIYEAIRHPDILQVLEQREQYEIAKGGKFDRDAIYREADGRYGYKLFLTMAKRIGLVVPKRGPGARFVLNDRIIRFLVISLIRPGGRMSYEKFKEFLFKHYGLAVDDDKISQACEWCGTGRLTTLGGIADEWLIEMLDASGVLVKLSDSCSLVMNPFDGEESIA
jgi:hypothetical protein